MIRANSCLDGLFLHSLLCAVPFSRLEGPASRKRFTVELRSASVWRLIRLPAPVNRFEAVPPARVLIQVLRLAASKALAAVCFPANLF